MANSKVGDRFAKLVIAELADIHALIHALADFAIADLANKSGCTIAEAKKVFEDKRKPRAKKYASELLERLNLEG